MPWQTLAQAVRADSGVPIVLIVGEGNAPAEPSGHLDGVLDRYGDIFSSPILGELARRANGPSPRGAELVFGSLVMRPADFEVFDNGEVVRLTLREFELLRVLMLESGHTVSLEKLKADVWGAVGESIRTD